MRDLSAPAQILERGVEMTNGVVRISYSLLAIRNSQIAADYLCSRLF
jgi:hypothetical protein